MTKQNLKKPNVIFIVMDGLRPKNLGCYGYLRNTSPNIDSLAKKGILFQKHFSTNGTTDNSFLSYLSGRHIIKSFERGVHACDGLFYTSDELKSFFNSGGIFIQEILKKYNYKTYCLKHLHGWQKRGFDYYFEETFSNGKEVKQPILRNLFRKQKKLFKILQKIYYFYRRTLLYCLEVRGIKKKFKKPFEERATNKAIEIIRKNKGKENFFMLIDYVDTHRPYNPRKFMGKFKDNSNLLEWVIARYDEAILYSDYQIGKVIKTLKEEKLFDNTIIFFLSDHGESLGEHRIYFDHHGLYDISFHTPLIVCGKNLPVKKIDTITLHEDIPPTILDMLGIKYDKSLFDGQSLISLIKNKKKKIRESFFLEEYVFARKIALRTDRYKYIEAKTKKDAVCINCNKIHGGVIELYDLHEDPDEKINLAKRNKEILIRMRIKLEKKIKEMKTLNEKRRLNRVLSKI